MILILSESRDTVTFNVIKWIERLGGKVILLTEEDILTAISITPEEVFIKVDSKQISFSTITAYWYRRSDWMFPEYYNEDAHPAIKTDINREIRAIKEILHRRLLNIPNLSSLINADLNRIQVLDLARSLDFKTPDYIISTEKKSTKKFKNKYLSIINKPLWNGLTLRHENSIYINYTTLVDDDQIRQLDDSFFPSLFMEYVDKIYECRAFIIDQEVYTMAIFSQEDSQTNIDHRKYNIDYPNRVTPYSLPSEIEKKILDLMNMLELKTGSIDLLRNRIGEYIFLEVNPIGQFLHTSIECNYNLDKIVAEYLIKIQKNAGEYTA